MRNKAIILIICILLAGLVWYVVDGYKKPLKGRVADIPEADITLLTQKGQESLTDIHSVPLPNGKTLYFGIPADYSPSIYCGSGGCRYHVYFGDTYISGKPTYLKEVSGFNSYSLDCDTGKATFNPAEENGISGSITVDKANKIVRVYWHLNVNLGSENIYHIADDGTPKLIASYDNTCGDPNKPVTNTTVLFLDKSYPNNLTAF